MKLRSLGFFLIAVLATLWLLAPSAWAEAADEAKRHFTNGVHLFEDRNFAGALVEFEASFKQNPTAAALQNIAVCQKGLFRYADANATLERMLREFRQLSAEDRKAAEDAMREMSALIGTIVVRVTPSDARVSVNDSPLAPDAAKGPIKLAAGEYRIAAEAPGFARQEQRVNVVSGQKDGQVVITLIPLSGTLVVHAHDSQAAISLDGTPVGYDEWKGPASAGSHEVYIYTSTQRHKNTVVVYAGQTTELEATLKPEDAISAGQPVAANGPPPYVAPSQHGIYGLVAFGADTMGSAPPVGLNQERGRAAGGFGGITFGYRFSTGFAAEFDAHSATRSIGACASHPQDGCSSVAGYYTLLSSRVGPAIRVMTNGRKGRFIGTIGVGAVVHSITLDTKLQTATGAQKERSAVGSYLLLGGSYEANLGHFLISAGLHLVGESGDAVNSIKSAGAFGLEFGVGYGQW